MPYYLRLITAADTKAYDATPCATKEDAMTTACAALRYGAKDAWVDDEKGNRVANFEDIKKHCGLAGTSN